MTVKRSRLRESAHMEECTLLIPKVCNYNWHTTVLAHVGPYGSAKRNHDDEAVYACSACHDAIDGRSRRFLSHDPEIQDKLRAERKRFISRAIDRTRCRQHELGLLPG